MKRKRSLQKNFTVCMFMALSISYCSAQKNILEAGVRLQKTVNLYSENGIFLNYSNKKIKRDRLYFGLTYISSRFGSAFHSNAIKQDIITVSGGYYFKKKKHLRPFVKLNTGYFHADYGNKMFDILPHQSLILMPETGLSYTTKIPLKVSLSLAYNLITGNGMKGPGTLYPLNYALGLSWTLRK